MKRTIFLCCGVILGWLGMTVMGAEEKSPVFPVPKHWTNLKTVWEVDLEKTQILLRPDATPQEQYAAERLQKLVANRFKKKVAIRENVSEEVTSVWFLGTGIQHGASVAAPERFNGFSIDFVTEGGKQWTVVSGRDGSGTIYGADVLFDLLAKKESGEIVLPNVRIQDYPTIPWRGRPHSVMRQQLLPGQLDAYIFGRINFSDYRDNPNQPATLTMDARKSSMGCPPGKPIDEALAKEVLAEYHRRGMFVYGTVSCNISEGEYGKLLETYDELLRLGCDGVWISMDDTGGGANPVKLVETVAEYLRKTGMTGHRMAFTPPPAEYQNIDKPLNWELAKIETFRDGIWFFTRVPCREDRELTEKMGLTQKPGWWYNYCEVPGVDPKAGFIHSSAILTSQRKDNRPSYMNLLPITPGWGAPTFEKIRDAGENTSHVLLWALCGGWPAEYALGMFGQWAWNPEECEWEDLRDAIYDHVWGPSQLPVIRAFDEKYAILKTFYILPRLWNFRTPDNSLVRLKETATRPQVLALLDELDTLAQTLEEKSFEETALEETRLRDFYLEPLQANLRFARKMATLEYPDYEFAKFETKALEIRAREGVAAADRFLAEVHAKIPPMLETLSRELAELKDIEPVLELWRQRLAKGRTCADLLQAAEADGKLQWKKWLALPITEILPFMENPTEGNLTAIFANVEKPRSGKIVSLVKPEDWKFSWETLRGNALGGLFKREGMTAAAIVLPRHTQTQPGDSASLKTTFAVPKFGKNLWLELFLVDSRLDNTAKGYREIEVWVQGKSVFKRDIADEKATDWISVDVTEMAKENSTLEIQVRVNELRTVHDHTSGVFVGPACLVEKEMEKKGK